MRAATDRNAAVVARDRQHAVRACRQGWSIVDQEYEIGFRSVSVPVVDGAGKTVAALNVCCPSVQYCTPKK